MKTMKVKVIKASPAKWYADKIGEVFTVDVQPHALASGFHVTTDRRGYGIFNEDFEILPDTKIVEHEGVKYEVPEWATVLTRDSAEAAVFCWENDPNWGGEGGGYWTYEGRRGTVRPYVTPKPEGNFCVKI